MPTDPLQRGWRSIDILRAVAIFFAFLILIRFLWAVRSLLIVVFLGVLFGLALSAGVEPLHARFRIKRGIAAILILAVFLGILTSLGVLVAPTVRDQSRQLSVRLPQVVEKVEAWLGSGGAAGAAQPSTPPRGSQAPQASPPPRQDGASDQQPPAPSTKGAAQQARRPALQQQVARQLGGVLQYLFPFVSGAAAAVTGVILLMFLAIYIASEPSLYRKGLLHLFPHRMRTRADEVLGEIATALQRWLIARLLAMIAIGAITTGALLLLRVESALLLGILAGLLEFIPLFGPIVAAIPAVGLALAESPQKAIWVTLAFVLIQQIEGNVVTPLLLKNRVDIPPALTIVTIAVMGLLFGFLGLLVAEPLLAAIMVAVKMLWVEDVVGDEVPLPSDNATKGT